MISTESKRLFTILLKSVDDAKILYKFNVTFLRSNCRISRPEFIRLSNLIVEAFPMEENTTYYLPAHKNDQAQGKLYVQYTNYKAQFRSAGLCKKRQYVPKRNGNIFLNFLIS